jgi:hypothetical protein
MRAPHAIAALVPAAGVAAGFIVGLAACASAPEKQQPPAPAEITLAVTSPVAGAELLAAEHPTIVVSGTVATSDAAQGSLEAWVNGARVNVAAGGTFRTEITPEPGINHIKVEGGNGLVELVGQEFDVLWSPEFMPPIADTTGYDLPGALELELGQRFFDSRLLGSALDLTTNPVVARDVASALELILWQLDLKSLLPASIHFGQGSAALDIAISSVTPSSIVSDARIVDGAQPGVELSIDLLGVSLGMTGNFMLGGRALVVTGGIAADLHATARLTLGTADDGSVAVTVSNVSATTGQLVPDFQGANGNELNALIAIANSEFRGVLVGLISTQLIPAFTNSLPPLLQQVLGATDQLLDNINFTLDPGLGTPVTLTLDGRMGALDIAAGASNGHVTVRQDITVRTTGTPAHPSSRGAARLSALTGDPVLNTSGVHLVVRQDFLNALLHAVWNAGLLEGKIMAAGLAANVSAKLPPVVRPTPASSVCKVDGERCDVQLQLGQVQVDLLGQGFAIHASAGARIQVDGGTVSLKIQQVPDIQVWETSAIPGSLTPDTVKTLITSLVWPMLFGAIGDNLKFQLPLPDLAALGLADLSPNLASAQLELQMRQRPSVTAGRLILGADLTLTTPPPP